MQNKGKGSRCCAAGASRWGCNETYGPVGPGECASTIRELNVGGVGMNKPSSSIGRGQVIAKQVAIQERGAAQHG